ncbi:MAG: GNAT family N-acetyltransferase [Agathobacter sp.]|nr:GNAT family N-acetyltransferase [Agathobacter sp.]
MHKFENTTPSFSQIQALRQLWKDTFGDSDAFLDIFFDTAFSLERCICTTCDDSIVAALYWFDCAFSGEKIAYIYAIATAKEFRGQGICHSLMEYTHRHLKKHGYVGAILSPAEASLFNFYKKMGYETCAYGKEIHYTNDAMSSKNATVCENQNIIMRKISKEEFAKIRPSFLPPKAVLQENENLDFLEKETSFYVGTGFLLAAQKDETHLQGIEFLGDTSVIPSIMQTLNCSSGIFRTTGTEKAFGMYLPLIDIGCKPTYIGFIFD